MKNVLFCASRASHIKNFHLPYIDYFKDKGYNVDVIVQGKINDERINKCFDFPFTKNPFSKDNIKTIFEIKKVIETGGYDMICSNTTLAGVAVRAALMLIKAEKRPYLVHISHGYMFGEKGSFKSIFYLMCEKITSKPVNDLVVMNNKDYVLAKKYNLGKNLHYIYGMGLNPERFPPLSDEKKIEIRTALGVDDNSFIFLCVGEFSSRKNQKLLIEAFNILSKTKKNIILVFAGDGQTLDQCKDTVQKYELEDKIRFLGQVDDINSLYRSCDLLVSASRMEGLPFNVMESLMCGLPVVVSDIKGHNDLIINNENGFLFEKDNILDFVNIVDKLISDRKLYTYIKSNTYLPQKYQIENAKPQLLKILDKNYIDADIKTNTVERK